MKNIITILVLAALLLVVDFSSVGAQPLTPMTDRFLQRRIRAFAFPPDAVQLLDSPFKAAMQRDVAYLFSLDPDRLLSRFRVYAGLTPKAPEYGGWESSELSGHTLGHYLSALSMYYAATKDEKALKRINYIIEELKTVQEANGNGYVGAIPEGERLWNEIAQGNIWEAENFSLNGIWSPWYTMHKIFAGLLDAYWYAKNENALMIATRLADWVYEITKNLTYEQWQKMLDTEFGGMNEVLISLHGITRNNKYLELANKFYHAKVLSPMVKGIPNFTGLHSNTQIPKVLGVIREYELIGSDSLKDVAEFFWEEVVNHHTYVIGGNGYNEYFGPQKQLRLGKTTMETCPTYNMLKLTRHLYALNPEKIRYIDYYERALYNHILASQEPTKGMMTYLFSTEPGFFNTYSTPEDAFWCCVGTGMENHVKYNESIYFHNQDTLYVLLFIPSELTWKEKALKLRQETDFPYNNKVRIEVYPELENQFLTLKIRHPSWAQGKLSVTLNGSPLEVTSQPGAYLTLAQTWNRGDVVELSFPMELRVERMPNNPNRFAILYGPIVLAGVFGSKGMPEGGAFASNRMQFFDYPNISVPCISANLDNVQEWVKPLAGTELWFHTVNAGIPNDVILKPIFETHHQRYTIYWDVCNQ